MGQFVKEKPKPQSPSFSRLAIKPVPQKFDPDGELLFTQAYIASTVAKEEANIRPQRIILDELDTFEGGPIVRSLIKSLNGACSVAKLHKQQSDTPRRPVRRRQSKPISEVSFHTNNYQMATEAMSGEGSTDTYEMMGL